MGCCIWLEKKQKGSNFKKISFLPFVSFFTSLYSTKKTQGRGVLLSSTRRRLRRRERKSRRAWPPNGVIYTPRARTTPRCTTTTRPGSSGFTARILTIHQTRITSRRKRCDFSIGKTTDGPRTAKTRCTSRDGFIRRRRS